MKIYGNGHPYTRAIYDGVQAGKFENVRSDKEHAIDETCDVAPQIEAILKSAAENGELEMVTYKLRRAIDDLRNQFGQDLNSYRGDNSCRYSDEAIVVFDRL